MCTLSKIHLPDIDSTETNTSLILNKDMKQLEVIIKFIPYDNRSNRMNYSYSNIQLFIIYGTYSEILRGKYEVQALFRHRLFPIASQRLVFIVIEWFEWKGNRV